MKFTDFANDAEMLLHFGLKVSAEKFLEWDTIPPNF
jgi:hypothetical protein